MPSIDADGCPISYREVGQGPTVILLHSSACSGGQWRDLVPRLAKSHRVLTPDLPGYGRSGSRRGRSPKGLTADGAVLAALAATGPERVHVVGHSYGGAVALDFALRQPERLASLTLLEPVAFHLLRGAGPAAGQALTEIEVLAARVRQKQLTGRPEKAMACFVDYWNGRGTWQSLSDARRGAMSAVAGRVVLDFEAVLGAEARLRDLAELTVPTLLLAGERSPFPARLIVDLLTTALPDVRRYVLARAGHMLPLTHPDETASAVLDHLFLHSSFTRPRKTAA